MLHVALQFSKPAASKHPVVLAGLQLKLLTFNRQMRIFGIMQMDLQWDYGGTINAQMQISAIPLIADSASTRCSPATCSMQC